MCKGVIELFGVVLELFKFLLELFEDLLELRDATAACPADIKFSLEK